jgi:hypothetical protein
VSEITSYTIEESPFNSTVRKFLKKWHYSDYVNIQAKHTFCLYKPGKFGMPELIGVCIYTRPAGPSAAQKYYPQDPDKVLELRRLCLIDDTPKNSESFFVGYTLRWLGKNTNWEFVLSYADENQNHKGIIYKASNFNYLGLTQAGTLLEVDGKRFHTRTLTMIDRPYGIEINKRYKDGDENVRIVQTLPKHIYTFKLKKQKK